MPNCIKFVLIIIAILYSNFTFAHGPSRQKVVEEMAINAPPEKVWSLISDFCSIAQWNPQVKDCQAEPGNKPDTVRTITLENGEQLEEKLVKYIPEQMKYQYMLLKPNVKALPINTLGSFITVMPDENGGTMVEWKGAFYRSFPGPTPPPELSDEAATKAVSNLFRTGLLNLKEMAE